MFKNVLKETQPMAYKFIESTFNKNEDKINFIKKLKCLEAYRRRIFCSE